MKKIFKPSNIVGGLSPFRQKDESMAEYAARVARKALAALNEFNFVSEYAELTDESIKALDIAAEILSDVVREYE